MTDTPRFDDPKRVAINRVYTRKGDTGTTSLVGGQRVAKHDLRIETYGAVDELNAFVGAARQSIAEYGEREAFDRLDRVLLKVQHQLFNLGSVLATLPEDVHPRQPRVTADDAKWLEDEMDRANAELEPLRSFVLPGGSRANVDLHVCRTICRRVERLACALAASSGVDPECITYLNRLSDAFFVWSRYVVALIRETEVLWEPNRASEELP